MYFLCFTFLTILLGASNALNQKMWDNVVTPIVTNCQQKFHVSEDDVNNIISGQLTDLNPAHNIQV